MNDSKLDPRTKNKNIAASSHFDYLSKYTRLLSTSVLNIHHQQLIRAVNTINQTIKSGRTVFVAGNGGSASLANHFCQELSNAKSTDAQPVAKSYSMVSNSSLTTALANDFSFEDVLKNQIEMMAQPGDSLVLISSSGNSLNVINACSAARKLKIPVIALTGFQGGKLKVLADVSLHIAVENYGIVEDAHQMLLHVIAQRLAIVGETPS